MSKLIEVLYPLPDYRRTPLTLLRWWESRRIAYNRIVGSAGLVTLAAISVISLLPPSPTPPPPLFLLGGALVWGVAANVFYTLGWFSEMLARQIWGREAPDIGPVLFRQGVIFAVGLTLLPIAVVAFDWGIRLLSAVFG